MEAKDYQEIINTADCNAEANYVGSNGQYKVMGWAKVLIDVSCKAGIREVVKWIETFMLFPLDNLSYAERMDTPVLGEITLGDWQAFKESKG